MDKGLGEMGKCGEGEREKKHKGRYHLRYFFFFLLLSFNIVYYKQVRVWLCLSVRA